MSRSRKMKKFWQDFYTALYCEDHQMSSKEGISFFNKFKKQLHVFNQERRDFLKTAGIAGAIGAAGMVLPFGQGFAAPVKKSAPNLKIAIIGGGLGGLACADVLVQQGFNPQIYEAQSHVGGRCTTLRPDGLTGNDLDQLHGAGASEYLTEPGWNIEPYTPDSTGHFQVAEKGAELIDNLHKAMLGYAKEFKLPLEDYNKSEGQGEDIHYYGVGDPAEPTVLSEEEVVGSFREFVPIFREAFKSLTPPTAILAEQGNITEADKQLDNLSIKDFLDQNGLDKGSILYSMLEENYANEYGDEIDNLSVLTWLQFAHADRSSKFRPYGVFSDERYHIVGGNDLVALNIAKRVDEGQQRIHFDHKLTAVAQSSDGKVVLTFAGGQEVEADIVVFATPFSVLRDVEGIGSNPGNSLNPGLQNNQIDLSKVTPAVKMVVPPSDPDFINPLGLTVHKLRAIHLIDYGHSSKIHYAFNGPVWRPYGNNGVTFSDRDAWPNDPETFHNTTWETNHTKAILDDDLLGREAAALLTDYIGGDRAIRIADFTNAQFQGETTEMLARMDLIFTKAYNLPSGSKPISDFVKKNGGNNVINKEAWFSFPLTKGSYVSNMPNYFMQVADFEGMPDGEIGELFPDAGPGNWRIFFAGEHCSPFAEWQGFMEGALLAGIRAANQILGALKKGKIP